MTEALKEFLENFELRFNDKRGTRYVEFVGVKNETLPKALKFLHASDLLSEIKRLNRDGKLEFYFDDEHINITPFKFNENKFFNYNNKTMKNRRNRKNVNEAISPYAIVKNIIDIYKGDDQEDIISADLDDEGKKIYALMLAMEVAEEHLFVVDGDSLIGIYNMEDVMNIKLEKNFSEKDAQELSRLEFVELMIALDDAKVLPENLLDDVEEYGDTLEFDGEEWLIFSSYVDAEEYAKEYYSELIDDIGIPTTSLEHYASDSALRDYWEDDARAIVDDYLEDARAEYLEDNYSDFEDALEENEDLDDEDWLDENFDEEEWSENWVEEYLDNKVYKGVQAFEDMGYEGKALLDILTQNDIIDLDDIISTNVDISGVEEILGAEDYSEPKIGGKYFYCYRRN